MHACHLHGVGVVIATPACIFVMGHMCVHPLYTRVAMYLLYVVISVYLQMLVTYKNIRVQREHKHLNSSHDKEYDDT